MSDQTLSDQTQPTEFNQLGLPENLLKTLTELGYEKPSPIQSATIPLLLEKRDIIGQAQTGTGKTAAFSLPMLAGLDIHKKVPQVLVLAPTRELALQVAEAIESYAKHLKGFQILPVYGGQSFVPQLKALKRGVHVVVGTPGRVMDHMRRGTLNLSKLSMLVLDEADEMLRMGFIDDVEWVMEQIPTRRQIALFSATMPAPIKRVADKFLKDPEYIKIETKTTTADTINQRFWPVTGVNKLDALTRILEVEDFDAMIIFVRTKNATEELTDKLRARGFTSAPIHGDIQQQQREKTINNLKRGQLDILIATDVAARGLDVDRISHVLNYDIPYDPESYVHRIGRTGRAGRKGEAILFVAPREKRLLAMIERVSGKKIERMSLPTTEVINSKRIAKFKQQITDTLASEDLTLFKEIIEAYQFEHDIAGVDVAAAVAKLWQGNKPLLVKEMEQNHQRNQSWDDTDTGGRDRGGRRRKRSPRSGRDEFSPVAEALPKFPDIKMQRFIISVGRSHGVKPSNIVGAIANEANMESQYIGHIKIYNEFSTVDLPAEMPKDVQTHLGNARICGKKMNLINATEGAPKSSSNYTHSDKGKFNRKKGDKKRHKKGKPSGKSHVRKNSSGKKTKQ